MVSAWDLYNVCFIAWRRGLIRSKGLELAKSLMGYEPLESDYDSTFKHMFLTEIKQRPEINQRQ